MLPYTKLSGNARRFKALMGMSLREFGLLLAKVEKAHPGAERERPPKRPRRRAIGPVALPGNGLELLVGGHLDLSTRGRG